MKRRLFALFFVFSALMLTACRQEGQALTVSDAWALPAPAGGNSAVYFVIDNPMDQADTLLAASADIAQSVELHRSEMSEEGTMSMHHHNQVEVPPKSRVAFEPGGLHVMLIDLPQNLESGEVFPVTLSFQSAGEIQLDVTVRETP